MRAWDYLPGQWGQAARAMGKSLCEIRLRRGGPMALRELSGGETLLPPMEEEGFSEMISAMLDHSLYARESELDKGYFTLPDGSRAGVCGDFSRGIRAPEDVLSLCIRIARAVPGCAAALIPALMETSGALIVSPPGLGKTTLLRDTARLLSRAGQNVCLVDERGELAACAGGRPQLDVGPRTDVISGTEKALAMGLAVRSCAPDVLVTDEMGAPRDAAAAGEILRCGVRLVASCHGNTLNPDGLRRCVGALLRPGLLELGVLLGPNRGQIAEIRRYQST
ncbi:MAG: stage III sporulation protein AA [Eubacteriales bacterium]|nr:stage III sporulation protein AA [Eubacteriales bacterium]